MRIAQIATLATPVRERGVGSVESLVWLLTRELTRLGHEVTVFGAAGSQVPGELVVTLPGPYGQAGSPDDWQLGEWLTLCRAVELSDRFDVLHSHNYLWGVPLEPVARAPMVHTLHVMPARDQALLWTMRPRACVTAVSRYQWSRFPTLQPAAVIPHAVADEQFTFRPEPEDYLCFFGRFTPGKGPLAAIAAARALGRRLLLAGPRNDYYRARVEPLVDGRSVEYVGPVNGPERDRLLGGARALLYPVQHPEPFGLVMIEAMMCGTPVAAMRLGAVAEIVDEGVTGWSAETDAAYLRQVRRCLELDRRTVHQAAAARFSAARMAYDYAQTYRALLDGTAASPGASDGSRLTASRAATGTHRS